MQKSQSLDSKNQPPDSTCCRNDKNDRGSAHHYFEQALGFYESLSAQPSVERVRATLAEDKNNWP
jgi:hypothetical protein